MQGSLVYNRVLVKSRGGHSRLALTLCLLPFLSGCLPGYDEGGDDSGAPASAQGAPALNRSYKTNFLSLQMPSFGNAGTQGHMMPDSGPVLFSAFSTVEARRPPLSGSEPAFAAAPALAPFEPPVQPAAKTLSNFYAALASLASGRRPQPISIVHFGDDRIADDRFAGALREHLTSRFGSAGRGLMMPGLFPLRGMKVDRGGQWTLASAAAGAPGPYGITGVRMTSASNDAWMRFTAAQSTFDWIEVTFLTGPGMGTALVTVDGIPKPVPANSPSTNETSVLISAKAREILIKPRGDGPISVLSVATGTASPGISYSNLGLPGATAWTPANWTPDFAAGELRKLNPDLILLEYGTREGFDNMLDLKQYEMHLSLVIDQLKAWAPQASILIAGPPDSARLPSFSGSAGAQLCRALNAQETANYDRMMQNFDERLARWHSPPKLDAVRASLRRAAAASGAYFWDWAKYMGGPCSIHAWFSFNPPLAAPDHVTLTDAGDDRSARGLFMELMAGYDAYQRGLQTKAQAIATAAEPKPARAGKKRALKAQQR